MRVSDHRIPPSDVAFALVIYFAGNLGDWLSEEWLNNSNGARIMDWLRDEGLLDEHSQGTDRLRVWVEHLCHQPLPEQKSIWVAIPALATQEEENRGQG